jgi:hypothetical protein
VLPNITAGAAQGKRKAADCALASAVFVIAGDTHEEQEKLRALVRQQISFYASTPAYRPVLEAHGWGDVGPRLTEKSRVGDWGGMAELITDEMLDVYAVTSRWDDIPELLKRRYDGLLERVSLYVPFRTGEQERWKALTKAFNG